LGTQESGKLRAGDLIVRSLSKVWNGGFADFDDVVANRIGRSRLFMEISARLGKTSRRFLFTARQQSLAPPPPNASGWQATQRDGVLQTRESFHWQRIKNVFLFDRPADFR
jgi:hypothetical protein